MQGVRLKVGGDWCYVFCGGLVFVLLVVGCCGVVVAYGVVVGVFANGTAAVPESVGVVLKVVVCSEGASSGW